MPQLKPGDRQFLNLETGKVLTVTCDAISSAIVRAYPMAAGAESTSQVALAASGSLTRGPFLSPTRWCVESTGPGVSYLLADSTGADVIQDTATGQQYANGSPVSGAGNRVKLVALGDSRFAYGWARSATAVGRYAEGPAHVANWLSGSRFAITDVSTGGHTLQQMIDRFDADVAPVQPKYVLVMGGTNDFRVEGASLATVQSRVQALIAKIRSIGAVPIINTEATEATPVAAIAKNIARYNDWLMSQAASLGFHIDDYARLMIDPVSSGYAVRNTGTWWSDAAATAVHNNNLGAYYHGKSLAALLQALEPARPTNPIGYDDWSNLNDGSTSVANILDNPQFQGTTGTPVTGFTGNVPTGYTMTRTGTPTGTVAVVDVTDPVTGQVIGKAFQVTITAAANGDMVTLTSADLSARVASGNTISGAAMHSLASPANVEHVRVLVQADPGGGCSTAAGATNSTIYAGGAVQPLPEAMTLALSTSTITTPGTPVVTNWAARIKFMGNGAGTVWTVWAPRFSKS